MVRASRASVIGLACALGIAPVLRATDLHVPSQHATIQLAIIAALPGDRVLVEAGTYNESVEFYGKAIEVIGVDGAAVTTIDATGLSSSCVLFFGAEPPQAVLQGFTLTGGTGSSPGSWATGGGGIHILAGARPTVRECVIAGNSGTDGGGVLIEGTASDTEVATFVDCVVADNQASRFGGGIRMLISGFDPLDGQPRFVRCTIAGNESTLSGGGAYGGGVFEDCLIEGNVSGSVGGGVSLAAVLRNCWVSGNSADSGGGAENVLLFEGTTLIGNTATDYGGGYLGSTELTTSLVGCTLIENTARRGGGASLWPFEDIEDAEGFNEPLFANVTGCVLARNTATELADGVEVIGMVGHALTTTIMNCSFDGGDVAMFGTSLVVRNSIVRGVSDPFADVQGGISVRFCDIEGGWPGFGNIDADPLWVDPAGGDYALQPCSPCIDAGDPTAPADPDGSVTDMGAVPFEAWTDLGGGVAGSSGASVLAGSGTLQPSSPIGLTLSGATPSTLVFLVLGATSLGAPFKGGTLWPTPTAVVGLPTNASGSLALSATWPSSIPCGFPLYLQVWWPDGGAPQGFAGSNGLRGLTR